MHETDHEAVVVLGHPDYYPKFGFELASKHGILYEHEVPDEAFMVLELKENALKNVNGLVKYQPEFNDLV